MPKVSHCEYVDEGAMKEPLTVINVHGQNVPVYAVPTIWRGQDGILTPSLSVTYTTPHLLPGVDRSGYLLPVEEFLDTQLQTRCNVDAVFGGGLSIRPKGREHSERESSDADFLTSHPAYFESHGAFNQEILRPVLKLRAELKAMLEEASHESSTFESEPSPPRESVEGGESVLLSIESWHVHGGTLKGDKQRELPAHCITQVMVPVRGDVVHDEARVVRSIRAACREMNLDMAPVDLRRYGSKYLIHLQATPESAKRLSVAILQRTGKVVRMVDFYEIEAQFPDLQYPG